MENTNSLVEKNTGPTVPAIPSVERRMFLRHLGLFTASTAAFLTACSKEALVNPNASTAARVAADGTVDLGSGDIGILNYAYALEQLEAAFYTTAVEKTMGLSEKDKKALMEIREHEVVHRELFKAALGSAAIPDLEVDFSSIDWNSRNAVFDAANKFESTGVGAYNGAGKLLKTSAFLVLAGKIVSVEARHAAYTAYMLYPGQKFDIAHELINGNGLDVAYTPSQVLSGVQMYIKQKISGANLPS